VKVEVTRQAARNVAGIVRYLRERNPAASHRLRAAIVGAMQTIAMFPEAGRAQATANVRKLALTGFPYLIYFKVDAERRVVLILAVQHAARKRRHTDA
jgi:toxin ParE1/3/4